MARSSAFTSLLIFGVTLGNAHSVLAVDSSRTSTVDGQKLVKDLAARCRPWIAQPLPELKSLKYTYHLRNDEQVVELVAGATKARRGMWQGATLYTGLHALLRSPDQFEIKAEQVDDNSKHAESVVGLTVRPKNSAEPFHLEAGNGIDGSWYGYFSHSSAEMRLELDKKTLLPRREIHDYSQYEFDEWLEVRKNEWVPQLVIVKHADAQYRMHFAWQGKTAWLLTSAEIVHPDHAEPIAHTSDVKVNDEAIIVRETDARRVVRQMLTKNAAWLDPKPVFDSLEYTFHTEREDVTETCVVSRNGLAAFEVTHDGKGKMEGKLGDRLIVLSDGRTANAHRGDPRAFIQDGPPNRRRPNWGPQLRRYALIGCQFDLPLFELHRILNDSTVKLADGQWNNIPCHVATITAPSRSAYLGCGVMLGFTSWSYVHDLYPAYEAVHIDKNRLVPLHETFVANRDDRRFEVDFTKYTPLESDANLLVPLHIDLESKDYFTCQYDFQLIGNRQWLLGSVESWFSPNDKSRGTIDDVRVDKPSALADEVDRQLTAASPKK